MAWGYRQDYLIWLAERAWRDASRDGDYFEVFLYDDAEDDPGYEATIDDITSEPDDGDYEREQFPWGSGFVEVDEDAQTEVNAEFGDAEFDLTDTTGTVDSIGIVASLQYFPPMNIDEPDDYEAGENEEVFVDILVSTAPLDDSYDLDEYTDTWEMAVGATLKPMV